MARPLLGKTKRIKHYTTHDPSALEKADRLRGEVSFPQFVERLIEEEWERRHGKLSVTEALADTASLALAAGQAGRDKAPTAQSRRKSAKKKGEK